MIRLFGCEVVIGTALVNNHTGVQSSSLLPKPLSIPPRGTQNKRPLIFRSVYLLTSRSREFGEAGSVRFDKGAFPGGSVVKNPPANAGDMASIPGPGRSHMRQGS